MKKVCVLMLLLLAFGTECYGAASDDIYVRKDGLRFTRRV